MSVVTQFERHIAMSPEQATLNDQLVLGSIVFCVGVVGMLVRRDWIAVILGGQITLQGVWICLTAAGSFYRDAGGFAWGMLLAAVPIVQVLLGVSLVVLMSRRAGSWDVAVWRNLRESESAEESLSNTNTAIDHV